MVRDLHRHRVHVQLSSGISGIHHRRIRVQTIGYQPLIYVEPARLSPVQSAAKRGLDLAGAVVGILVGAPLRGACRRRDQARRRGAGRVPPDTCRARWRTFKLLKLRTMVLDAEERLVDLDVLQRARRARCSRSPRTRVSPRSVGSSRAPASTSCRSSSTCLRGEMSLVGPRPALPHEVAQFDDELRDRHAVLPGHHRAVAGRGPRQPVVRRLPAARSLLRRELVGRLDLAVLLRTGRVVISRARRGFVSDAPPSRDL